MQFQIPQFIETEDKIVGPLTIRQFLYVGGAAGLSIILYFTAALWLWFILSVFLVTGGVSLAFVRVNGQPLMKIAASALNFYWRPQIYLWQPERPELPKNESTMRSLAGEGFSWERIVAGLSLKKAEEQVLTGTRAAHERGLRLFSQAKERYEIVRGVGGERQAARRVDYR